MNFFKTFFLLFFLNFNLLYGQIILPGPSMNVIADPTVKNVYIPAEIDQSSASDRDVEITVNFINTSSCSWTPAAMAAFNYAVGIWEATLTSTVTIEINATFTVLPSNVLGSAGAASIAKDFGASDPSYINNTWYALALANKLLGSDISPASVDILATFNCNFNWYYGTDGGAASNQYDFVTVVLHEIGHGLGWFSSAKENQYGIQGLPVIYDRFIVDGNGVLLTDFPASVPSVALANYLTSDNLFWQSGSEADGAKLFAPTTWQQGSSISHFDDAIFDGTNNALMTHDLGYAEAIHNPGAFGVGVLQDIGWDAKLVTGIEDVINIYGFNDDCYFEPQCPWNSWTELYKTPDYDLEIGEEPYYVFEFIDEYPYNQVYPATFVWNLEVLHSEGRYVLDKCGYPDCNDGYYWGQLIVNDLPGGYEWSRNLNGDVRAEIALRGRDEFGYQYEEFRQAVIHYQPDFPLLEFLAQGSETDCSTVTLSFFANGATNYNIHYKSTSDPFYLIEVVPPGQYTYTISNLNEELDYEFKVEAYNETGYVISDALIRENCDDDIIITPNPPKGDVLSIKSTDEAIFIESATLWKVDNPQIAITQDGDDFTNTMEIEILGLPPGIYSVKVLKSNDAIEYQLITIL